ncbi:hypothetical protein [Cellulosimicrobium cellulans]|uniref:hypothetical protein n=1 Tax=Cellulosimicrobium cellulans TaxID=1710 RepID=UPI0024058AFC|nr:hypothetical protein [Cellulosimicrobium cellulans]MDF9878704.1 hypothetical protein [Cellulosimicrobium cellulans]
MEYTLTMTVPKAPTTHADIHAAVNSAIRNSAVEVRDATWRPTNDDTHYLLQLAFAAGSRGEADRVALIVAGPFPDRRLTKSW